MTELGKLYVIQHRTTFWVKSQDEADMDSVDYNPGDIFVLLSVEVDNGPWHELRLTCLGNDGTVLCSWQDDGSGPPLHEYTTPVEEAT